MGKKLEGAGLRGQVAGETSLCTVGQEEGLAYRGHKIETLAEKGTFEEVAYLLLYGKLPNASELSDYKNLLKEQRDLPESVKKVLREIPASAHPMAVMATGCSMLGNIEPEKSKEEESIDLEEIFEEGALPNDSISDEVEAADNEDSKSNDTSNHNEEVVLEEEVEQQESKETDS